MAPSIRVLHVDDEPDFADMAATFLERFDDRFSVRTATSVAKGLDDGFYVEDTGEGIPPDERREVFEDGYSTGYGGSGIGLTIVSRIAEAHGWEITLAESDEEGARFEFTGGNEK